MDKELAETIRLIQANGVVRLQDANTLQRLGLYVIEYVSTYRRPHDSESTIGKDGAISMIAKGEYTFSKFINDLPYLVSSSGENKAEKLKVYVVEERSSYTIERDWELENEFVVIDYNQESAVERASKFVSDNQNYIRISEEIDIDKPQFVLHADYYY